MHALRNMAINQINNIFQIVEAKFMREVSEDALAVEVDLCLIWIWKKFTMNLRRIGLYKK